MVDIEGDADMAQAGAAPAAFGLPLVSVIVTAHNYGRFLKAALTSVFGQSYPDIECIVVDDGSSDDTPRVLARAARTAGRRMKTIRNPKALGQGAASRIGFEASCGQYVVFMDADDVLEPHFVRDHIFVNLSSRVQVGLSASDIYQAIDGRIVVATGEALITALLETPPQPELFRPLAKRPAGPWPFPGPDETLLAGARFIRPGLTGWRWSPMTANMFRRDVLTMLVGPSLDDLPGSTDIYFCAGANALCGSVLIDKPLSYYRIHGGNMGVYQPQLTNVRTVRAEGERSIPARKALIEHLTSQAPAICARLWSPEPLLMALQALENDLGGPSPSSHLARCVERNRSAMALALGEDRLAAWNAPRAGAPTVADQ